MKKKVFAAAVFLLCLSILATGTVAYFSAKDTAHNVITTGNVDIAVVEKQLKNGVMEDYPTGPITGVLPGAEISKIVTVRNTGVGDAWIRVRVEKAITLNPDAREQLPAGQTPNPDLLKLDFDATNWVESDGWYYYKQPLVSGASTKPLFTAVNFDTAMGNAYEACKANVNVYAEAVQSKNNPLPTSGDYSQIPGWPTK